MICLTVNEAIYAPWTAATDDPERLSSSRDTWHFETAREAADWLDRNGFSYPSESAPYGASRWLSDEPYGDPHTGCGHEQSAHPAHVHPRVWAAIVHTVEA